MSALQKAAWYQLLVVLLTVVTVIALSPFVGCGSLGAFGLLGLLGAAGLFLRRPAGGVAVDERDHSIDRKAMHASFAALLVGFLSTCIAASFIYGASGAVPVFVVQVVTFATIALVYFVRSLATIILYRRP